jgi:tetratricopeptide (TPR) repeat protein
MIWKRRSHRTEQHIATRLALRSGSKKGFDKDWRYDAAARHAEICHCFANRPICGVQRDLTLSDYDEALKINPRCRLPNGRGIGGRREYDKVIADYKAISDCNRPSVYYNNAPGLSSKGELTKAGGLQRRTRIDPKNATALANRANLRKDRGELAEALADYDEALAINPKNATHLNLRGNTWWMKRDYDRAIADYSAALNANPNADGILANRGRAWLRKGDHDQAKQDLEEAIRLNPKRAYTFAYRAELQRSLNDKDAAMSDYDHAISLDPNAAISFGGRGSLRLENGDVDGALADLNEAFGLAPYGHVLRLPRPRCAQKSEYDNAIRDYDEALRLQPANAGYYNNRGFARFQGDLTRPSPTTRSLANQS